MKLSIIYLVATLCIIIISVPIVLAYSSDKVLIEFFYWDPSKEPMWCPSCESWRYAYKNFLNKSKIVDDIVNEYSGTVSIERIDITSEEGKERSGKYALSPLDQFVIVNNSTIIRNGNFTKGYLRQVLDASLAGEESSPQPTLMPTPPTMSYMAALSLGLFSGFSPCLMAMLAFILSYTVGQPERLKSGILRVLVFGLGFISALMFLGTFGAATLMPIPYLYSTVAWIVSILTILVGLNLIGLLNVPIHSKFIIQKLARKYGNALLGLFILGFIFYFISPCAAPLSFTVLLMLTHPQNLYLLALFGVGAFIPFLVVGIVAGGSPVMAARIRQHHHKIRVISGVILILYSVWLILFYLI